MTDSKTESYQTQTDNHGNKKLICECCGTKVNKADGIGISESENRTKYNICFECYKNEVCDQCDYFMGANPCQPCRESIMMDDY